jgi:hypothetical protein
MRSRSSGLAPGRRPWSRSACRTQFDRVYAVQPILAAIEAIDLDRMVLAGDRGMISNVQIEALAKLDGVDWITALKSGAIARLAEGGTCNSTCSASAT